MSHSFPYKNHSLNFSDDGDADGDFDDDFDKIVSASVSKSFHLYIFSPPCLTYWGCIGLFAFHPSCPMIGDEKICCFICLIPCPWKAVYGPHFYYLTGKKGHHLVLGCMNMATQPESWILISQRISACCVHDGFLQKIETKDIIFSNLFSIYLAPWYFHGKMFL